MTAAQAAAIRNAHDRLVSEEIEIAPSECMSAVAMQAHEKESHMREHGMFSDIVYDLEEQFPYLFD